MLVAHSAVLILQNKPLVDPNVFACVALRLYSTRSRLQQYGGVVESAVFVSGSAECRCLIWSGQH